MTTESKEVYKAIAAVTRALGREGISKDRKNAQQGYSFRGIDEYPNYLFSDCGKVLSLRINAFLTPLRTPQGYTHVVLSEGGKQYRLQTHRLIAEAFHGKPIEGAVVHHKNGIRDDNRADNLEWITQSENVQHSYDDGTRIIDDAHRERAAALGKLRRTTTDQQEAEIRAQYKGRRGDITRIANAMGISRDVVRRVLEAK